MLTSATTTRVPSRPGRSSSSGSAAEDDARPERAGRRGRFARDTTPGAGAGFFVHRGDAALALLGTEWDELAARVPTPFTTSAWLRSWWEALGHGEPLCAALHGDDGRLRAAALMQRGPFGGLVAAADVHSDDWDAVAEDEPARAELWAGIGALEPRYATLTCLRDGASADVAARALASAGLRTHTTPGNRSPYLELPADEDAVLAGASRNLRSQVRRRRRQLENAGDLTFRTLAGVDELDAALDELERVEASGWKGREGTAIASSEETRRLYRRFAHEAARDGMLRVHLLELDGRVIAGDLGCSIGGVGFLVKTGYDEALGRLSPGLVLRAEVLRASVREGLRAYDFLGPDDSYKLRWTDTVRPRVTLRAFRGVAAPPATAYHRAVRPVLKRAHQVLVRG
jgi:CelD/BcsL family acetyltransferase involved in cellulose biosynthesis